MTTKDEIINDLKKKIKGLEDENESLWAMLDESKKADVENWVELVEKLKMDVISRALMTSREKGDA